MTFRNMLQEEGGAEIRAEGALLYLLKSHPIKSIQEHAQSWPRGAIFANLAARKPVIVYLFIRPKVPKVMNRICP